MSVTILRCWRQKKYVTCCTMVKLQSVANIIKCQNVMLVTELWCWRNDFILVPNSLKPHQHPSPTSVTNIDETEERNRPTPREPFRIVPTSSSKIFQKFISNSPRHFEKQLWENFPLWLPVWRLHLIHSVLTAFKYPTLSVLTDGLYRFLCNALFTTFKQPLYNGEFLRFFHVALNKMGQKIFMAFEPGVLTKWLTLIPDASSTYVFLKYSKIFDKSDFEQQTLFNSRWIDNSDSTFLFSHPYCIS